MSPFEFLNYHTKKNVMSDPENEKYYNSFIINSHYLIFDKCK